MLREKREKKEENNINKKIKIVIILFKSHVTDKC